MLSATKNIREAQRELTTLERQVAAGYHRNPAPLRLGARFQAGTAVGILGNVEQVKYQHKQDGKHYKHDFNGDGVIYAVDRAGHRDLLIVHNEGLPLWDEFS